MTFLVVIFLLVFCQKILAEKQVEIQFVDQYIQRQSTPIQITTFLCWNQDDLQGLSKVLHDNFVSSSIQNIPRDIITFPKLPYNINIVDMSCENSTEILLQANKGYNYRLPNHWLLLWEQFYQPDKPQNEIFEKLNCFIDTKIVLATRNGHRITLDYIYKLDKNSPIIFDNFAEWVYEESFKSFDDNSLSWRRHNIGLYSIRVSFAITDNTSYQHMIDYRHNEVDTPTKLNYVLTNALLDYINASKNFSFYTTWYNPNSKDQNGTLIGSILNREIDITGTPFFCKEERISWMDCIAMTTPVEGFFIFRQPPLSYVKNIYALPFSMDLWLADISFFFLSALLLYLVILWEWAMLKNNNEAPEYDMIHATFSDSLLFTMGAVCQQGYATEPKGTAGKILILTVFITLIFLFTAYTAYTVVLFQDTADDIKNLQDLYESDINLGIEDTSYYRNLFPKYTEPLRKKIYQEKVAPKGQQPGFYPLKEGIAKMRKEYFAFFIDQISGYKVIHDTFLENEKCGLREINYLYENNPWIVSPKNVPFKEIFTIGYRKLVDSGLFRREIKKRIKQRPECSSQGNNFRSAGILDLYPVYMLLIIGVICSSLLLIIELLAFHLHVRFPDNFLIKS